MNPQLKKGVLELCVLSQLTKEDKYGYELTDAISREMSIAAYSARTAHPFQRNGAPFRFKLSKAQQVY